jgi:dihydropyrimidinase
MSYDLVIHGGRVVVPGIGEIDCDVAVAAGRVAALGVVDAVDAERVIDAGGHYVLPGIVDPHVHFANQRDYEEECLTETRAAVLGGVTTVGVMVLNFAESYHDFMPKLLDIIERQALADVFCHFGIFDASQVAELQDCAQAYGVRSFKFFMSGYPGICPAVDDGILFNGFREIAALGPDAIACIHAENGAIVAAAKAELQATVPDGGLAEWTHAHPPLAEELAIQTGARLAAAAGTRLYVVHVSSAEGLACGTELKAKGADLILETTSPYLCVDTTDEMGLLMKMVPPVRDPMNREALWQGVDSGAIDVIGTDNTARDRAAKAPEKGLHGSGVGLPCVGVHLPSLLHFGYHERGLSLERLVTLAAKRPAEIFGLYPRKGTICVGGDADLVLVDTSLERTVDSSEMGSYADYYVLEGRTLRGWPVATIKGGQVIVEDHRLLAEPGTGSYLERTPNYEGANR